MNKKLALIIMLSAAVVGSIAFSQPANADGVDGPYIDTSTVDKIKTYDYSSMLVSCVAQGSTNGGHWLSQNVITNGNWESSSKGVRISWFTDNDGLWDCNKDFNGSNLLTSLSNLGWKSPIDAACSMGATQLNFSDSGGPQAGAPSNATCGSATTSGTVYMKLLSGSGAPATTAVEAVKKIKPTALDFTPDMRYAAAWQAFNTQCKPTGGVIMQDATGNKDINGVTVNTNGTYLVNVVNKDTKVSYVRYKIDGPTSGDISIAALGGDNGWANGWGLDVHGGCPGLASFMSDSGLVGDYSSFVGGIATPSAYKGSTGNGETAAASSCAIDGIGWIICPVMGFMGKINDGLFSFISGQLTVDVGLFKTDSGTYKAWAVFRNYANILFIIAFLIVVFSQVSSIGVSNYGIKKLLPKLIAVAILVNISYFICQIAVDLSNLLGVSIKSLFDSISKPINAGVSVDKGLWTSIIGGAGGLLAIGLATGALLLSLSIPVLLASLLALASAALIIFIQKSLIVMLIAVSPIAFALYLLPNTEKIFKEWRKLFWTMLVLFPTISILFGAGNLAASVLLSASNEMATKIAALAATSLPLLAIIPLLQNALKGTGVLGDKLSGLNKKANAGFGKQIDKSRLGDTGRYIKQRQEIMQAKARAGQGKGFNRLMNSGMRKVGLGSVADRYTRAATDIESKEFNDDVTSSRTRFESGAVKNADIIGIANGSIKASEAERHAAVMHVMEKGAHGDKKALLESSSGMSARTRTALADTYAKSGMSDLYGKAYAAEIREGKAKQGSLQTALLSNLGSVSSQTVAGNKNYAEDVKAAIDSTASGSAERQAAKKAFESIIGGVDKDESLAGRSAGDALAVLEDTRATLGIPHPATPATPPAATPAPAATPTLPTPPPVPAATPTLPNPPRFPPTGTAGP